MMNQRILDESLYSRPEAHGLISGIEVPDSPIPVFARDPNLEIEDLNRLLSLEAEAWRARIWTQAWFATVVRPGLLVANSIRPQISSRVLRVLLLATSMKYAFRRDHLSVTTCIYVARIAGYMQLCLPEMENDRHREDRYKVTPELS